MIILLILLSIIPMAALGAFLYLIWIFIKPILKFAAIGFGFVFIVALLFSS